jgi:hypothetical protein
VIVLQWCTDDGCSAVMDDDDDDGYDAKQSKKQIKQWMEEVRRE